MVTEQDALNLSSRLGQLDRLQAVTLDNAPLVVHGSVARAALMGEVLPNLFKPNGTVRDIDVFAHGGLGKFAVEDLLDESGLAAPSPIDAGLCEILIHDGKDVAAKRGDFTAPLQDLGVFDEMRDYELPGTDGIAVRSFSPAGMLAAHLLQRPLYRPDHYRKDRKFILWLNEHDVNLPNELSRSIEDFHDGYKQSYPHAKVLTAISEVYRVVIPEIVRQKFRHRTHKFMLDHAGRSTPFIR